MSRYADVVCEKTVVITYDYSTRLFTASDGEGKILATGKSGKDLGKKAWAEGVSSVKYAYDLGLDHN